MSSKAERNVLPHWLCCCLQLYLVQNVKSCRVKNNLLNMFGILMTMPNPRREGNKSFLAQTTTADSNTNMKNILSKRKMANVIPNWKHPGGSDGKESACNTGFDLWSGRSPKSFLIRIKEVSGKADLKLNTQKTKIMAYNPITSWQIDGGKVETVADFIFLGSKITANLTTTTKLKDTCSLGEKLWQT